MAPLRGAGRDGEGILQTRPHYVRGILLAFLGGVALSFGGPMFRSVQEAGEWQVLFYRAVGFAIGGLAYVLINRRGRLIAAFQGIGRPGIVAGLVLGAAIPCYVLAVLNTTIANALFVVSMSPLFAAIVGLVVLRERVKVITWLAAAIALVGVGIMMEDALAKELGAGLDDDTLFGNLMAVLAALGLGSYAVVLRFRTDADMSPCLIIAGVVSALVAVVPISGEVAVQRFDLMLCLAMGLQAVLGFALLTFATKYIPAAEVALLSLMEVMLGPVWTELLTPEAVSPSVWIGGPIVLAAVIAYSIVGVLDARRRRSERRAAPAKPAGRRSALPEPPLPSDESAEVSAPPDLSSALAFALRRAERADADHMAPAAAAREDSAPAALEEIALRRAAPVAPPPPDPFAEAARSLTVEYRLRERLTPILNEWVEANLPRIAEGMVRHEVRRLIDRVEAAQEDSG